MKKVQWICDNCGKIVLGSDWLVPPNQRWYSYTVGDKRILDFCCKECLDEKLKRGVKRHA